MRLQRPFRSPIRTALCLSFGIAVLPPCATLAHALQLQQLPEAPSALLGYPDTNLSQQTILIAQQEQLPHLPPPQPIPPCEKVNQASAPGGPKAGQPQLGEKRGVVCIEENPIQPIVSSRELPALTWREKGTLAARDVADPFNLVTVLGYSGVVIGSNAHTAYGPGWKGFGKLAGYSLMGDMQGEFFGTFAIPSLTRQDPRYYRSPGQRVSRRVVRAIAHTFVTRHDDGTRMLNYGTLLGYPISAELSNLYVPGIGVNAGSTAKRIALGYGTDPIGSLLAEFLPDLAKRIHIRVIFVQQILQQVAEGAPSVQ